MDDLSPFKVNITEDSKSAQLLIRKIGDAISGAYRPLGTLLNSYAERKGKVQDAIRVAEVDVINDQALLDRTRNRILVEEIQGQRKIEATIAGAADRARSLPDPNDDPIDPDWLVNFFNTVKLSAEQMRELLARILAGEGSRPGSFSRRTVSIVQSLDQGDVEAFERLCSVACEVRGDVFVPTPMGLPAEITPGAVAQDRDSLRAGSVGLLHITPLEWRAAPGGLLSHDGQRYAVSDRDTMRGIAGQILTVAGTELHRVCGRRQGPVAFEDFKNQWDAAGIHLEPAG